MNTALIKQGDILVPPPGLEGGYTTMHFACADKRKYVASIDEKDNLTLCCMVGIEHYDPCHYWTIQDRHDFVAWAIEGQSDGLGKVYTEFVCRGCRALSRVEGVASLPDDWNTVRLGTDDFWPLCLNCLADLNEWLNGEERTVLPKRRKFDLKPPPPPAPSEPMLTTI